MSDRRTLLERLRNNPQIFSLEEQISRGHEAAKILGSDLFDDAFLDAELELIEGWRKNEDESPVGRERAHAAVKGLDVLHACLRRYVDDGIAAEKRVEDAQDDDGA